MRKNKYTYLWALARIRDYIRESLTDAAKIMPDDLRKDFNLLAKKLGAESDGWCAR